MNDSEIQRQVGGPTEALHREMIAGLRGENDGLRAEVERLQAIEAAAQTAVAEWDAHDPWLPKNFEVDIARLRAALASSPVLPDRRYVVDEYCATCDLPIMDAEPHEAFHASAGPPEEIEQ